MMPGLAAGYAAKKGAKALAERKRKAALEQETRDSETRDSESPSVKDTLKELGAETVPAKYARGGKISEYGGMEKYGSKAAMKKHEKAEMPSEEKLEKKMGKNMARADMQKVASKTVKKHEKAMHGMKCGGSVKYAKGGKIDGCATKGKTKGRMV